jgi:hypothetical protein
MLLSRSITACSRGPPELRSRYTGAYCVTDLAAATRSISEGVKGLLIGRSCTMHTLVP